MVETNVPLPLLPAHIEETIRSIARKRATANRWREKALEEGRAEAKKERTITTSAIQIRVRRP
jgi:hypothetical protein